MRAALVVLIVLAAGFDHREHARSTQDALSCADCHATRPGALRPGHPACFGRCHGAPPPRFVRGRPAADPARTAVCESCHTQTALAGTDRKALASRPPSPAEHVLAVGHKRHAAVACAQCHLAKPAPAHARCGGCHTGGAGKGPPMSLCNGCHLPADAAPAAEPAIARVLVRSAFSHPRHAARGGAGARCRTCHDADTDARELPHPTAETCATAGCHDARAAFATTEACTRCHQDVPAIKYVVPRPAKPFSHTVHLPYVAFVACSTCHPVASSGEVGLARHAECASCHADDFGSRDPQTCGACHDATEPWRRLVPDRPPTPRSDFGASLDHGKHARACTSCHSLTTAVAQLRPPRGHAACTGTGCHATAGGAPPAFTACAGCHELGLADRRAAQRLTAKWSVRRLFVHATHARGPGGQPLACTACHVDVSGADLMAVGTPPKSTCAPCHDGQASFKLTGTACTRCHPSSP